MSQFSRYPASEADIHPLLYSSGSKELYLKVFVENSFQGIHLGDSSPMSSSPSTPARNTVSSIPAVWYLREKAFSVGKNPICRLIIGTNQKNQYNNSVYKLNEVIKDKFIKYITVLQLLPVDIYQQWAYLSLWLCIPTTQAQNHNPKPLCLMEAALCIVYILQEKDSQFGLDNIGQNMTL